MTARWAGLLAVLLVAVPVWGAELRLSTTASVEYDENAANREGEEQDDVILNGSLGIRMNSSPGRPLSWSVDYSPRYEKFLDLDELDRWNHTVNGALEYRWSDTTAFSASARFTQFFRTSRDVVDDVVDPAGVEVSRGDEEITRGFASLELTHRFSSRWSAGASVGYSFVDYELRDRSDFESATAAASLMYQLSPRQSLGGGLRASRQIVDEAGTQVEQETDFLNLFLSWTYMLSPLWRIDLNVGPTFVSSEFQDTPSRLPLVPTRNGLLLDVLTCPLLLEGDLFDAGSSTFLLTGGCRPVSPPVALDPSNPLAGTTVTMVASNPDLLESDTDSTTAFADVTLQRAGERTSFSLSYRRSEGDNFGGRTTTVLDVLNGRLTWKPDRWWNLQLQGTWAQREQATDVGVGLPVVVPAGLFGLLRGLPAQAAILGRRADGTGELRAFESGEAVKVRTLSITLRVTRQFSRPLSAFAFVGYRDQSDEGRLDATAGDFDEVVGGIGLTYAWDPIRL